jgi:hypothetical protein
VRVTSDRQTLILAGEMPPRRSGVDRLANAALGRASHDDADSLNSEANPQRVTFISARVDAVITQGLYSPSSLPALPPEVHQAYVISNRGSSAHAANAYARTRDLTNRTPLIDTYA